MTYWPVVCYVTLVLAALSTKGINIMRIVYLVFFAVFMFCYVVSFCCTNKDLNIVLLCGELCPNKDLNVVLLLMCPNKDLNVVLLLMCPNKDIVFRQPSSYHPKNVMNTLHLFV